MFVALQYQITSMHKSIEINGTGKKAIAEIYIDDYDEITVSNIMVIADNGRTTYYNKKQCANHQWLLMNAVAPFLDDFSYMLRRVVA